MRHVDPSDYSLQQLVNYQTALMYCLACACFTEEYLHDRLEKGYDISEFAASCCAEPLFIGAKIEEKVRRIEGLETNIKN